VVQDTRLVDVSGDSADFRIVTENTQKLNSGCCKRGWRTVDVTGNCPTSLGRVGRHFGLLSLGRAISDVLGIECEGLARHTESAAQEAAGMARRQEKSKRQKPKTVLRFPDLEQSKNTVVNSLPAASSQESYSHAIDEFIGWYCSEPRLAFNRTVVLRYRFFLEQKNLAPSTINVRLAAVRRLAYEASDSGLLSPELAAGIRRVKSKAVPGSISGGAALSS
jgi:hypothetical protein